MMGKEVSPLRSPISVNRPVVAIFDESFLPEPGYAFVSAIWSVQCAIFCNRFVSKGPFSGTPVKGATAGAPNTARLRSCQRAALT